jgi:hypothetical protein
MDKKEQSNLNSIPVEIAEGLQNEVDVKESFKKYRKQRFEKAKDNWKKEFKGHKLKNRLKWMEAVNDISKAEILADIEDSTKDELIKLNNKDVNEIATRINMKDYMTPYEIQDIFMRKLDTKKKTINKKVNEEVDRLFNEQTKKYAGTYSVSNPYIPGIKSEKIEGGTGKSYMVAMKSLAGMKKRTKGMDKTEIKSLVKEQVKNDIKPALPVQESKLKQLGIRNRFGASKPQGFKKEPTKKRRGLNIMGMLKK